MGRGKITNPLKPISINAMKNRPINIISGHIFSVPLFSALFITAVLFTVSPFSAPLFAQSKETGILYLWEISSGKVWKSFGDDDSQQKYKGEIKGGQPDGLGFTLFTDGTKYMGQWQDGKQHGHGTFIFLTGEKMSGEWKENEEWNITKYDINGNIIARYADGVLLIDNKKEGVLFYRQELGSLGWFTTGNEEKDYKYEGEIENGKPNGTGTLIYRNGTRYVGEYLDGTWNGQGSFYFPDGEKWVGEFKEDAPWNITWFDRDGNIIVKWGDGVKQK